MIDWMERQVTKPGARVAGLAVLCLAAAWSGWQHGLTIGAWIGGW